MTDTATFRPSRAPRRGLRAAALIAALGAALALGACGRTDTPIDPSQLTARAVSSNGPVAPQFQGSTEYKISGGTMEKIVERGGEITRDSQPLPSSLARDLVNSARFVAKKLAENPIPAGGCGVGGSPQSLSVTYATEEIVDVSGVIDTAPCHEVYSAIQLFINNLRPADS